MPEPDAEIARIQRRLYEGEKRAGWDPSDANTLPEEIAHLHEEISEAFRAFRVTKDCSLTFDADGKPQGVPAELADAVIGMFYIAERFGFDLLAAVETKHAFNLRRSYAAEGRRLHEPDDATLRWLAVQEEATELQRSHQDWRWGQALFNALRMMDPPLAEQVRGTNADPFHDNGRLPEFMAAVMSGQVIRPAPTTGREADDA